MDDAALVQLLEHMERACELMECLDAGMPPLWSCYSGLGATSRICTHRCSVEPRLRPANRCRAKCLPVMDTLSCDQLLD
jgi:hypothetical protein